MTKPRCIVVGPLPPPVHGVAVSTSLVLASRHIQEQFLVEHLDTSDHRPGRNTGVWDAQNIWIGLRSLISLTVRLRGTRGVVYVPLSQNRAAFLRDSLFIWAAHLRGWKVAGHLRGSDFRTFLQQAPRPLQAWMRWTLCRLDSVAVMGESLRWVFDGLIPTDRIAVVPNGTPEPEQTPVLSDPDHVLCLTNLRRRKGVAEAVEAALLVRATRPSTRFTFAGEWESDEFERAVRARADGNGIVFRPPVNGRPKAALLASAAVFLFPPLEPEGHPRVVLEALAAGLPVVTTDRGAISETVTDGHTGYVLREADPQLLADRMLDLLQNDALRNRMRLSARASYRDRFTQDAADRIFVTWLLDVVGSRGSTA